VRRDGGADEFARDDGRSGIVEVRAQLRDVERVHVAADRHRVADLAIAEELEEAPARRRIAIPAVGPRRASRARLVVPLRHARLLRKNVPRRR
jgi:hypothetical protein